MCEQSGVDYIEEDQIVTMTSQTSLRQWHLDRIDQRSLPLDEQYTSPNNGSGVDIYVFDTGQQTIIIKATYSMNILLMTSGIYHNHTEFEGRAMFNSFDQWTCTLVLIYKEWIVMVMELMLLH